MKKRIETALNGAIDQLLRCDSDLLYNDVNERSISRRLANYLEPYFFGWNVDCEYNRNHADPKRLYIQPRQVTSDDLQATTVYPDIIVHKRGSNENLLVIEMKKTTSSERDNYDLGKLIAFKEQLHYQYAIFVKVQTIQRAGIAEIKWV